jgi:hypothetical protein
MSADCRFSTIVERVLSEDERDAPTLWACALERAAARLVTRRSGAGVEVFRAGLEADLRYFAAGKVPSDIPPREAGEEQVLAAYRAFRKELKSKAKKR